MGVHGLFQQEFVKNTVRVVPFKHLIKNQIKLPVDVSCELYRLFARDNPSNQDERDSLIFQHFGSFCRKLRELNYHTVAFVLDGPVPLQKMVERATRVKQKQRIKDSIIELNRELVEVRTVRDELVHIDENGSEDEKQLELYGLNLFIDDLEDDCVFVRLVVVNRLTEIVEEEMELDELIKKKIKQNINLTKADTECFKEVVNHYGFPIIQSLYETDSQIAIMKRKGYCSSCNSGDSDLLWCGVDIFKFSFLEVVEFGENASVQHFSVQRILNELGWNHQQFIEYCFMVGTDFKRTGLYKVGHVNAIKVINECKSIQGYIGHLSNELQGAKHELDELLDKQREKLDAAIEKHDVNSVTNQQKLKKSKKPNPAPLKCDPGVITRLQASQHKAREKQNDIIKKLELQHQQAVDFHAWFVLIQPIVLEYNRDDEVQDIDWNIDHDSGDF